MARTPFKLRSSGPFKMMGSSPMLKNDIYKTYVDESGNEITENLGTGSFGEARADEVRQQNRKSTAEALINQKKTIEKQTGQTFDVKTPEGKKNLDKAMTNDQWQEKQSIIAGGRDSASLTYTGADADRILSLNRKDREAWEEANPNVTVEGSGGRYGISTKEMNEKVEKSKKTN